MPVLLGRNVLCLATIVTDAAPQARGDLWPSARCWRWAGLAGLAGGGAPFAYVANEGSGTVSVIDTATIPPSVVATVPVATFPNAPFGVAVTPDGAHAYVANYGFPGTVSVIDTATNTVGATITVGSCTRGVAVTSDGKRVYVANEGDSTVSVIDTATTPVCDGHGRGGE
ncbi:MAG: YncE family protein [Methylocella sp.]